MWTGAEAGPRPFRPQVIGMQQLSQINRGVPLGADFTALSILALLLNILYQEPMIVTRRGLPSTAWFYSRWQTDRGLPCLSHFAPTMTLSQ